MKVRILIALVVTLLVGVGSFIGYRALKGTNPKAEAKEAQAKSEKKKKKKDGKPVATVETVAEKTISDAVKAPGVVRADGVVTVTTFSEGLVNSCPARLGLRVAKGQTLCLVENDNPSATYLPFQVQAPVDGTVGEIHVSVGARVNKGDKIATLLRSERAKIEIELPLQDAEPIRVGTEATWEPLQNDAKGTKVRVTGVSPLPDPATRTVKVELTADKATVGAPGALGNITFVSNVRNGFEISEDAIAYRGIDPFVRTVENGKVKWVPVKLGRVQQGKIEITQGLQAGKVVVLECPIYLADGDAVGTKPAAEAPK
jgi:multidrug efflux pump subunit AcrA (membrane-fusion protein)